MASREELSEQLGELKPALRRTLAHERATVEGAGKPWDMFGWLVGNPIDQRYPTGPAYHVSGRGGCAAGRLGGARAATRWVARARTALTSARARARRTPPPAGAARHAHVSGANRGDLTQGLGLHGRVDGLLVHVGVPLQ